jgi:hypothetical protein
VDKQILAVVVQAEHMMVRLISRQAQAAAE